MSDQFWASGSEEYESGLRARYDSLLSELRTQLLECTDEAARAECQTKIAQAESEYQSKLREIDQLFF